MCLKPFFPNGTWGQLLAKGRVAQEAAGGAAVVPRLALGSAGHWRGQSLLGRVDTAEDQAGGTGSVPS